jgi:hypothetical protein
MGGFLSGGGGYSSSVDDTTANSLNTGSQYFGSIYHNPTNPFLVIGVLAVLGFVVIKAVK